MNSSIASLILVCGIAGFLYLDREKSPRVSMALWLPGIWIASIGSRPLTIWLGGTPAANAQLEGSPLDAAVYAALLALAVIVLTRRNARTRTLLIANRAILIYFLYCLISVAWSYHPDVSLKRWIKAIGDLAMVLVIATDKHPLVAIRRTVSRVGFVLLPTSLLLIKYFPALGRNYNEDGLLTNTGMTLNKNSLGVTVLVVSLVVVWNLRSLLSHKDELNRGRRLVAQGVLLAFGLALFVMADCKTCIACFILGSFLMIASGRPAMAKRRARVHALWVGLVLLAGLTLLLGGGHALIESMGRDASMSGRVDIWPAALSAAPNPIVGAGFEGFWLSPNVRIFQQELLNKGFFPPLVARLNEAHNGYIEVYLNLGLIGVGLVAAILIAGYLNSVRVIQLEPKFGGFVLAFIAVAVVYSITEAGFRTMSPTWVFLLLVLVCGTGVTTRRHGGKKADPMIPRGASPHRTAAFGGNQRFTPQTARKRIDSNMQVRR
jgi:exopolysaccharide production protein ExoQ